MLYKLIPALVIVIAVAIFFTHPTPFREPEYLAKRERVIRENKERKNDQWLIGDYNDDAVPDSAYVSIPDSGPDSGMVFIRFNHHIPSISLDYEYKSVLHIERTDETAPNKLYIVAQKRETCEATGFLFSLAHRDWETHTRIEQEGCRRFESYRHLVELLSYNRYRIAFRKRNENNESYREVQL